MWQIAEYTGRYRDIYSEPSKRSSLWTSSKWAFSWMFLEGLQNLAAPASLKEFDKCSHNPNGHRRAY